MKTGKLAESALKRSVFKQLHKQGSKVNGAAVGADCAFFEVPEGQILAWCAQEAAVAGQADMGNAAELIIKSANNLAAVGAVPMSALISLMLPETFEEPQVKELMSQAAKACEQVGMTISGGDTNISYAVSAPIMTVTVMGYANPAGKHDLSMAKAGQDIVVSKWIGLEGTALLAKVKEAELLARYPAYLVEEAAGFDSFLSVLPEAKLASEYGVAAMHDMSQGGVFGALWELAEGADLGLTVDLKKIPIRQETVEVCEVCGVNPYEMRSAGSLLMTADDGQGLADFLQKNGISAAVIGKMTDSNDKAVLNDDETRFLDRPRGVDVISESFRENK